MEELIDADEILSLPIIHFTPTEVKKNINKLNIQKALQYEPISDQIAKQLPRKVITLLTVIFNLILSLSYFPIIWKYVEIIVVS